MAPQRETTEPYNADGDNIDHHHQHISADQVAQLEPVLADHQEVYRRESFIQEFVNSNGPPQIVLLIMLLALGFGSTIGVVPAVMTDRYARLNHGFDSEQDCSQYAVGHKPQACLDGSADAQNAVAMEQLVSNTLTFFTSSLIGSLSDEHGRKGILVLGVFLSCLSPLCLVLVQLSPNLSPFWYYSAGAITGLVNWIAVALSALSDVMPPRWRAPSFGLLLAGFSLGFAMAPQLAILLGRFNVSLLAFSIVLVGLIITVFFFPETLPPHRALEAKIQREEMLESFETRQERMCWTIYRPIWELSILNRNRLFRLLTALAFFSGMVSSGDRTLILYYIEERLGFNDQDVATMFLIMGILGIFVQGVVLKLLNDAVGERNVVIFCFILGTIHNFLYGIAENKATIFIAVSIAAFGGMAFPTISAIKSNNVEESEQGRIQGALYSVQALASATGPLVLRLVYHYTKDGSFMGPGSMFVVAAGLYLIAVYCAYALPKDAADSRQKRNFSSDAEGFMEGAAQAPLI